MILNSVVLPDPLGPIKPVIEPCSTFMEQASTALIPPKDLVTFSVWSIAIASPCLSAQRGAGPEPSVEVFCQRRQNSLRHEQHNEQQDPAEHSQMNLGSAKAPNHPVG